MITPAYLMTATERVLPRMMLDFTTASLDPRVTLTRALNTATRVNSSGFIETVNANLPRFDYSSTSAGTIKGLLIEESRTNNLANSNNFSGGTWTASGLSLSTSSLTSPDGTLNATLMTGSAFSYIYAGGQPNAVGTWTQSFFFSKGTITNPTIRIQQAGNGYEVTFDLNAKTAGAAVIVGTGGSISAMTGVVSEFNATWLRCSVTFTTSSSVNNMFLYVGNGTLHIYGAQLEAGAFATSYIPTTSTSLTRNADVVTMTGTNFSDWYNATEGTLQVIGSMNTASTSIFQTFAMIGDANNSLQIFNNLSASRFRGDIYSGGSIQKAFTYTAAGAPASGTTYNIIVGLKANDFAMAINGNTVATANSGLMPVSPSALYIGSVNIGIQQIGGYIRKLAYYNQKLTNAEIQAFSK
jgi:hypothetical protein